MIFDSSSFQALLPPALAAKRSAFVLCGRRVPADPLGVEPIDRPRYPRLARLPDTHADGPRAERRAAASPTVRPLRSTPALRAQAARYRIAAQRARHQTARVGREGA